jgi:hypothetical protein
MLTTRLVDNKFRENLNRFACPLAKIQDRNTIAIDSYQILRKITKIQRFRKDSNKSKALPPETLQAY